jgi:hypothetical protein
VLVSSTPIPPGLLSHYAETGSERVEVQREALEGMGLEVVEADLLAEGDLIRHDSEKLARAVLELAGHEKIGRKAR